MLPHTRSTVTFDQCLLITIRVAHILTRCRRISFKPSLFFFMYLSLLSFYVQSKLVELTSFLQAFESEQADADAQRSAALKRDLVVECATMVDSAAARQTEAMQQWTQVQWRCNSVESIMAHTLHIDWGPN